MQFPCEIIRVSGAQALTEYQRLKNESGFMPVILGDEAAMQSLLEPIEYLPESFAQLIEQAQTLDVLEWLEKRQAQDPEYYDLTLGEWEDLSPATELSVQIDISTGKPFTQVLIALIPVSESWQIPAFLKIGGRNDCPTASEHAALFKYWDELYGIRVAGIVWDVLELEVLRPPTDKQQALLLAQQQFIYCPDIVYQGTQSIAALASTLLNGRVWFFWWD